MITEIEEHTNLNDFLLFLRLGLFRGSSGRRFFRRHGERAKSDCLFSETMQ